MSQKQRGGFHTRCQARPGQRLKAVLWSNSSVSPATGDESFFLGRSVSFQFVPKPLHLNPMGLFLHFQKIGNRGFKRRRERFSVRANKTQAKDSCLPFLRDFTVKLLQNTLSGKETLQNKCCIPSVIHFVHLKQNCGGKTSNLKFYIWILYKATYNAFNVQKV